MVTRILLSSLSPSLQQQVLAHKSASKFKWEPEFLPPPVDRYPMVPYHQLPQQERYRCFILYGTRSPGAKYDFAVEHYYYPVKKDGTIARSNRELAIPYKKIIDDEYMKSIGYTPRPDWVGK